MATTQDGSIYFEGQYSKLPRPLVPTAHQLNSFASHFVDPNEPKAFKWREFMQALEKYPGDDIDVNDSKKELIPQQEMTVSDMAGKIAIFLRDASTLDLRPDEVIALRKSLETTFTSLKKARDDGWADFSKSNSSSELDSSWEYRFQFALGTNRAFPDDPYISVVTIKLEANIKEMESWWGLQSDTKKTLAGMCDVMEFRVGKDFKDPGKGEA
ncbi:hypothetical protein PM082_008395 [Marasmius tenuissimus]|nr:hypothetical protein PM082_008395 [Marasmius tenuissimus]